MKKNEWNHSPIYVYPDGRYAGVADWEYIRDDELHEQEKHKFVKMIKDNFDVDVKLPKEYN